MIWVSVQEADFVTGDEWLRLEQCGGGAVASFTGMVRGDGGLTALTLEQYPGMTQAVLQRLAETALARWPLSGVTIIHRVGQLAPAEKIVFVGTVSAHRAAALDACAFLIDRLKTDAPFWKKEIFADGRGLWVEAKATDDAAAARW
jgi:molybdopterin synthase catalytic subunit